VVAPGPEEHQLIIETLLQLERLLDGLPALAKQAFLMSQLDGMKQAEIAQALSISVSSVKRYLTLALTQCYFAEQS
jgi:RNA polymerase sigma-70 factor (ECF subfamily)